MLRPMTHFPVRNFMCSTVARCLFIMLICLFISIFVSKYLETGFLRFVFNLSITELILCVLVLSIGLNPGEKKFILEKVKKYFNKQ